MLPRTEIDRLRKDNDMLSRQVQRLVRDLLGERRARDADIADNALDDRLIGLNRRISRSQSLQYIYAQIPLFVCRELGYQRCALLVDDRRTGVFTVRATDGYHDDAARRRACETTVPDSAALYTLVRNSVLPVHAMNDRDPQLREVARALGVEEFAVAPLRTETDIVGIAVAGSSGDDAGHYTRAASSGLAARGLSEAAELAANAIAHCTLYWELAVERNLLQARIRERTRELEAINERMRDEARQARDFQQTILAAPPAISGVAFDIVYRPLDLVGGDVYDVSVDADDRIRLFVADATGHGVGASLATMFIKGEYDQNRELRPAELLRAMNDDIARLYGRLEMRFTATCVEIDRARRQITYASAGHPAPCRVAGGDVVELESGGPFMGIVPGLEFPEWTAAFEPGDGLYVYTDGVVEEWNAANDAFGERRLFAAIGDALRAGRPVADAVCASLDDFVDGHPLHDDITLLGVRWQGAGYDDSSRTSRNPSRADRSSAK